MSAKETSRVFSIPPGVGFLETLVEALFGGKLVPGFRHTGDPLALADVTIYLPTRRAARALRDVLLRKLDGQSAILPVIRIVLVIFRLRRSIHQECIPSVDQRHWRTRRLTHRISGAKPGYLRKLLP